MRIILAALGVIAVLAVAIPAVSHAQTYLHEPNQNQGSNS